ncbi:MAG: tRNA-guanine transglycosylase [Anaerolineae bacterium]
MPTSLSLPRGPIQLPAFLPDATRGTVRGADAQDVANAGIQAVVMNVFHLMQRPGSNTIKALGGLHAMFGWQGPILTDSGGFQAFSLIANQPQSGSITDQGLLFRPERAKRPFRLTPEKSVQLQLSYGAAYLRQMADEVVWPSRLPWGRHLAVGQRDMGTVAQQGLANPATTHREIARHERLADELEAQRCRCWRRR